LACFPFGDPAFRYVSAVTTPSDFPPEGGQHYPAAPPPSADELRQPDRPRSVELAFRAWLVVFGVGLIGDIIGLVMAKQILQQTLKVLADNGVQTGNVSQTSPSYGSTIFQIVLLVAYVALAFAMRNGANWARIVLTIIGVLGVVVSVLATLLIASILVAVGIGGILQLLLTIISLAAVLTAIVFMYRAESTAYFKRT
jgi:hypothetical protein